MARAHNRAPGGGTIVAFAALAETLDQTAGKRGRNERVETLAAFLRVLSDDEIGPAVYLMLGRGSGTKSGVSWSSLAEAVRTAFGATETALQREEQYVDAGEWARRAASTAATAAPSLSISDVRRSFDAITAARGRREKVRLLTDLLRLAAPVEIAWIARNAVGEMRSGVQEGLALDAVARASGRATAEIRRAFVAVGDIAELAVLALREGGAGLETVAVQIGRPIPPMLAESASSLAEARAQLVGGCGVEWKLDGARIQIHKRGDVVTLWSRRMTDVTSRLPEVAAAARQMLRAQDAIVEGEVVVVESSGRHMPFQDVMSRWMRRSEAEKAASAAPVTVFLFDCLYRDGELLIDRPYHERWQALDQLRGDFAAMPRVVIPPSPTDEEIAAGDELERQALSAGHEGVMVKALDSPYVPGRRGAQWLKVKAEATLDLVIIGADWGTGRRHRWLSNYHLACRDQTTGEFLSVGETFKGLTDAQFALMTERLQALIRDRRGSYVSVEPAVVVEVLFNGVQRSTRLPSGAALRFARIKAIHTDKRPDEADTLGTVQAMIP